MYSNADCLIMCINSRIARSRKLYNLLKSSIEFEPSSFLMSVFYIVKCDAVMLVSDTGDIGWGYELLPAGKETEVMVRECVPSAA